MALGFICCSVATIAVVIEVECQRWRSEGATGRRNVVLQNSKAVAVRNDSGDSGYDEKQEEEEEQEKGREEGVIEECYNAS